MSFKKQEIKDRLLNGHYFADEYQQPNYCGDAVIFAISMRGIGDEYENAYEAIRGGGELIVFSIDKINQEVVITANKKNESNRLFYCVPYEIFASDRELVSLAVYSSGESLKYASDKLAADKGIVLMAVTNNPKAIQYASYDLQEDNEVVLAAFQRYASREVESEDTIEIRKAFKSFAYGFNISNEIIDLCKGLDPIEALTKAINCEKLTKKLALGVEVEQPRRKLKI